MRLNSFVVSILVIGDDVQFIGVFSLLLWLVLDSLVCMDAIPSRIPGA